MTTDLNKTQIKTRAELRKSREEEANKKNEPKRKRKKLKIRLIPIWLRLVIIAILIALSATAGVVVGYGVIGDGNPSDALKKSTWQHIVDLVEKDTVE
ncbi:DNA-directed RNA polymerase subunit beta [Bacillus timonensis]|nr:DNA-directed RNA polymerase subunit beta [Bacillus timonensis]